MHTCNHGKPVHIPTPTSTENLLTKLPNLPSTTLFNSMACVGSSPGVTMSQNQVMSQPKGCSRLWLLHT